MGSLRHRQRTAARSACIKSYWSAWTPLHSHWLPATWCTNSTIAQIRQWSRIRLGIGWRFVNKSKKGIMVLAGDMVPIEVYCHLLVCGRTRTRPTSLWPLRWIRVQLCPLRWNWVQLQDSSLKLHDHVEAPWRISEGLWQVSGGGADPADTYLKDLVCNPASLPGAAGLASGSSPP